jgi:putative IMPACT (imprinted ancient) family translation regulator
VRAYTTATAEALKNAEVVTVRSVVRLEVCVEYSLYERAALLIDAAGAKQDPPEFTDRVALRWIMPEHTEAPLLDQLRELTRGSAQVSVSEPFYAPF